LRPALMAGDVCNTQGKRSVKSMVYLLSSVLTRSESYDTLVLTRSHS
jgi:hypothetical protein